MFADNGSLRIFGKSDTEPAKKDEQSRSVIDEGVSVLVLDGGKEGT